MSNAAASPIPAVHASRRKALVLFSGGQDSTACLAWALDRFAEVETLGFDYGQRHRWSRASRTGRPSWAPITCWT